MYETLVRQHDLSIYHMPTIDDAIDKLKDIESRKKSRRMYQKQRAAEEKVKLSKRKADEMEGEESEVTEKKVKTVLPEANGDKTDSTNVLAANTADNGIMAETAETEGVKDVTMETAEGTEATTTREPSTETPKEVKVNNKSGKSDGKNPSMEERKYLSTKPAPQGRGHTSYLTFAFLMPEATEQ